MSIFLPHFLFVSLCSALLTSCYEPSAQIKKINGANLVNPADSAAITKIGSVSQINAEWVSIIPFAFSSQGTPQVHFNSPRQWWGERPHGTMRMIEKAHELGLKVMLKPHVWMSNGWIGEYKLSSEEEWIIWEQEYEKYILVFAQMASNKNVEMLCVGTEIKNSAIDRPEFWLGLIEKIRKIYGGKITYAANWDDYHLVPFWDKLDYIGVDAYFPLIQSSDISVDELNEAWTTSQEVT